MMKLRSLATLAALAIAPAAHAVPSVELGGFAEYDAGGGIFSFFSDPGDDVLDLFIAVGPTGIESDAPDAFLYVDAASGVEAEARATAVSEMLDPDGLDTIRFTFSPTQDGTGLFDAPFYTILTGEFGAGFAGDFFDPAATALISAVPLPAGGLLLLGGLGAIALRRRG